MKFFPHSAMALLAVFAVTADLRAQESELGELPPLPNLNLGDPDTKPTWNQSRLRAKMAAQEQRMEELEAKLREADDPDRPRVGERIASSLSKPQKAAISQQITVQNSLPPGEDGITASGSRLRAFGDDSFWGPMPEPTPEESLANLPPLPDLRTPEQVTKTERLRDNLVARQEVRKEEADAVREQRELRERVVVNRPLADPSTALVQVESQRTSGGAHSSASLGPPSMAAGGQRLRPFGDAQYWGNEQPRDMGPEEALMELPPLPDLRVPDQVTKKERLRDNLVARQALRKAEAEAERERRELMQRVVVNRPAVDPSTALVHVHPQSSGAPYVGNQMAPESVIGDGRTLKPFNENSTYTQGNQIVYKGPRLGTSSSGGGLFRRSPKP